jgi:hypothetical protein
MHDVELQMKRGSYSRGFFLCLFLGVLGFAFAINGKTYTKNGARLGIFIHIVIVLLLGILVLSSKGMLNKI